MEKNVLKYHEKVNNNNIMNKEKMCSFFFMK